MRVAEAVGPDFPARPGHGDERIVVGNPVAAVLADRAGRGVLAQIGNDTQDFAYEVVEALRIRPDGGVLRLP